MRRKTRTTAFQVQRATRAYVLKEEGTKDAGVLINIFGGKITTYRRLAEAVMKKVERALGAKSGPWTARSRLPGGDFEVAGFDDLVRRLGKKYPYLDHAHAERLSRCYGTRAAEILGGSSSPADLGKHFGAGLYQREVEYLMAHEWAEEAEDILFRRTKRGIVLDAGQKQALAAFMGKAPSQKPHAAEAKSK